MSEVTDRFLRYVSIDTQSSEESDTFPSTVKQHDLAAVLYKELVDMGADDVVYDKKNCYVYAHIKATDGGKSTKTLGFISHMDTSPETSGENVRPKIINDYDGNDIVLNDQNGTVLKTSVYPEIKNYIGQTLIVTDGTTLLGADDKAGIAEIMTAAKYLISHPEIEHGNLSIAFTPDEEIGAGTDRFDIKQFGADYAFTVDGGALGEVEYETFNAASATIMIYGVNVHTGEAKNKMINAARIATEFEAMLPSEQKAEFTEGREGFIQLMSINGNTEYAELSYLIRDHDRNKFEQKKQIVAKTAELLELRYGKDSVTAELKDTYYNMREKIEPDNMFLIDNVCSCMRELGIEPVIRPVRGGTDGSSLSFKGLPCPNICTGGHNFHGRFEYCCVESMEKISELIVKLAAR